MAKAFYSGVANVARKGKSMYTGVSAVARKCKNGFIGVAGVARPFINSGIGTYTITEYNSARVRLDSSLVDRTGDGLRLALNTTGLSGGLGSGNSNYAGRVELVYTIPLTQFDLSDQKLTFQVTGTLNSAQHVYPEFGIRIYGYTQNDDGETVSDVKSYSYDPDGFDESGYATGDTMSLSTISKGYSQDSTKVEIFIRCYPYEGVTSNFDITLTWMTISNSNGVTKVNLLDYI